MKLTRRQMFAGLLAPVVAPKLLEAGKAFTIASKAAINPPNRWNNDTFYRIGVDFNRPDLLTRLEGRALDQTMLHVAAIILHRAVTEAAAGRKIIWCAPIELHLFVDCEMVGPVGPVPRCRHIWAYDLVQDRFIHRLDVDVAFTMPGKPSGTRYFDGGHYEPEPIGRGFECHHQAKIGDTIHIRRPIRWMPNPLA